MNRFREQQVNVARWLFVVYLFALFVSTSAVVAVEMLLLAGFVLGGELRSRFLAVFRQPLGLMTLALMAMLSLGLLYGLAEWPERLDTWLSWRRLLVLPMALALFDDETWKRRLTWAFLGFCLLAVFLSYLTFLGEFPIYGRTGVILANHAVQGMLFAAGAFVAMILAHSIPSLSPLSRRILVAVSLLLAANIIFVTPGRSGYLALLVLAAIAAWFLTPGHLRYLMPVATTVIIVVLLALSPTAQKRIALGVDEMQNYETSENITSMGIRMMMWQNALAIIKERPLLGTGLAGFREAYRRQVADIESWRGTVADDPHNQYLRIAAEHGLPGLAVFMLFIAAFFRQPVADPARILGLGVLLAWCATSLASGHFATFTEGRFLFLWCGAQLAATSNFGQPSIHSIQS